VWNRVRLLCIELAAVDERTIEQAAQVCRESQIVIFVYFRPFHGHGFKGLLGRRQTRLGDGSFSGVLASAVEEPKSGSEIWR
jgi:hypothetical protein